MRDFETADILALAAFLGAWLIYHLLTESPRLRGRGLNGIMNDQRRRWMEQVLNRENRIFDAQIMASLQNGAAFFASSALIAVGGSLALLQAGDVAAPLFSTFAFGAPPGRAIWEAKAAGLATVFIYAFFKFAWSYRLFNYAAILMGALPPPAASDGAEARRAVAAAAEMTVVAGTEFNRGQRAFFFALAYLGWFLGAGVFMATTLLALAVMAFRQFGSSARRAVLGLKDSD